MPEIRETNDIVTQITTVKVPPNNQAEVLQLMAERARFMSTQPGFVSVSLHKSEDGSHLLNYVQWRDARSLRPRTIHPSSARNGRASASSSTRRSRASTKSLTSKWLEADGRAAQSRRERECAALDLVIAGLDPAIDASLKRFCEDDGSRG